MSSGEESKQDPSVIGGHVKYAQGAISSALGYDSGAETKDAAVKEMRDAKNEPASAPTQSGILGTLEAAAGKLTGCEGMEKEGNARKPVGIEEASGTG